MLDVYGTLTVGGADGVELRLLPETIIGYQDAFAEAMRENMTFLLRVSPAIAGAPTKTIIVTPHTLVTSSIPPITFDPEKARATAQETLDRITASSVLLAPAVE